MSDQVLHDEEISSVRTTVLFVVLTTLSSSLAIWRIQSSGWDFLGTLFTILALVFLFYVFNYRTLVIHLTPHKLALRFGILTRTIPVDNIQDCQVDNPPWYYKYGGAGIHFYSLHGRYRASFNFLEFPRVVVTLRDKAGLVQEISFTTRQPEKIVGLINHDLLNL
jgi:hypothetical protein